MVDLSTVTGMLAFAATTGVITALLNQAFGIGRDLWREHVKRKSDASKQEAEASYLALRLAAILEGYAYTCGDLVRTNMMHQLGLRMSQDYPEFKKGNHPALNCKLPDLPPFPEEGWHSIDLKLAGRALDLRNHIADSQGVINVADWAFTDDGLFKEINKHAMARGKEAWDTAKDLRSRHGLPAFAGDFAERLHRAGMEIFSPAVKNGDDHPSP
jgi:hypothetical protein